MPYTHNRQELPIIRYCTCCIIRDLRDAPAYRSEIYAAWFPRDFAICRKKLIIRKELALNTDDRFMINEGNSSARRCKYSNL